MQWHLNGVVIINLMVTMTACDEITTHDQASADSLSDRVALWISSTGVASSAQKGSKDLSEYNDAQIVLFVQNSKTGRGETSLASPGHTGNSRSEIVLPDGWNLSTATVPGGGCVLKPIHLYNDGLGFYTLSVMTISVYGACPWLQGDYVYRLIIDNGHLMGGTVGKIAIE